MRLRELYETLLTRFGPHAEPATWWPIYVGRTVPPEFERAITNILVQNSSWRNVPSAVALLNQQGLLTAQALAETPEEIIATCVQPTGLKQQKTKRLKALAQCVVQHFGTEKAFCAQVTRAELLSIPGIGEETADRMLLYACSRLSWPVDTYCFRVLAQYQVIPAIPVSAIAKRHIATEIKEMVGTQMSHELDDWQRLHALMQLEGEHIRKDNRR